MTFNLRLPDELDYKIKKIAKLEHRSKNKEIEFILEEYVKKYEVNNGIIEINLDDE